ncbi:MAG TPA: LCP family protein [Patescibacteria group bacterium]|nr:LCP family protein [Patescibacteria group bacterium]
MLHKKTAAAKAKKNKSGQQPENLLDLNRSLPNYSYHPTNKGPEDNTMLEPREPKTRKPWKKIVWWTVGIIIGIVLLVGGWLGWKLLSNQIRVFGWGSLFSLFSNEKLNGEDAGHVNILLAGNSADDPNHAGANLTDSIMVLSVNTKNNTAFMLSVPRDFYVDIPGYGYAKINEAYQDGENGKFSESGYPSGGMGLLEKTVSETLGINLNYYALVNYNAVRDAVNAVGGIQVNIQSSDSRGLYDPSPDLNNNYKPLVKLSNGVNTLNGVQALALARARGDTYGSYGYGLGDFERTKNQRLIMIALKDKASSLGTLSNPVKLGELFDSVGKNVKTDLTLGNCRRLYGIIKKIPDSSITSAGLNDVNGTSLITSYTTRTGQSALIPKLGVGEYSDIQAYVQKLLNPPAATTTQ